MRAIGALTTSSHSQLTCARAVPPSSGPRMKPLIPTTIISVIARIRRAWSSKSRKTSELVIGAIGGGCDAERGAQRDELAGCLHERRRARLMVPKAARPDEQDAATAEPVGRRAGREQQAAEGERVGARDPLQRGRAAAEVAADGRQRDGEQRVVDHLDEERQAEREQRDPRRPEGGVGTGQHH